MRPTLRELTADVSMLACADINGGIRMRKAIYLSMAAVLPSLLAGCATPSDSNMAAADNAASVPGNAAESGTSTVESANAAEATPEGDHAIIVPLEKVAKIPDTPNDHVAVSDVEFSTGFTGHFITATVNYGGGCKPHEFKAYWDGSWVKTKPPGVAITLRHNGNGDRCKASITKMVQISIAEPAAAEKAFFVELTNVPGAAGRVDVRIP
jgi:hypothetical protein